MTRSFHYRFLVLIILFFLVISTALSSCNSSSQPNQIHVACDPVVLIDAINDANSDPGLTTLSMDQDCTIEFSVADNQDGKPGGKALPIITSSIKILGNNSTLTRDDTGQDIRFFEISSSGNLRLEDITLENGSGLTSGPIPVGGGAIVNDGGVLTLHNSTLFGNRGYYGGAVYSTGSIIMEEGTVLSGNSSRERGGALYIAGSAGIPISITDTSFIGNGLLQLDGNGGAIYIEDTDGAGITITDSLVENNYAGNNGGALYNADPIGTTYIDNVDFLSNHAYEDGGAIYAEAGSLQIYNSSFNSNRAYKYPQNFSADQKGGGLYINNGAHLISNCRFEGNRSEKMGGSLYNNTGAVTIDQTSFIDDDAFRMNEGVAGSIFNKGKLIVKNSYFELCSAYSGGALVNFGKAKYKNVTFKHNHGWSNGGHIFNAGWLELNFVTLYEGFSANGTNSIYTYGNVEIKDSIVVNYDNSNDNCYVHFGFFNASGENLDYRGSCRGFTIHEDPMLTDDGVGHMIPDFDSPVINAASDCRDLYGNIVDTDQRGVLRPQPAGVSCDLGAIELEIVPELPPESPQALPRLSAPENLTCREGDSNDYPAAGYLLEGETAQVIGRNSESTWLVINNPDWEGICWLFKDSVELEGNSETTQVFTAPPLVQEPEDSNGDSSKSDPVCKGDLDPEECKKAGGTYNMQTLPPCKCP